MDEDTSIINSKTRNEKIKNFLIDNKITLISSITILIAIIISFYSYQIYLDKKRVQISNKYNSAIIDYQDTNKSVDEIKLALERDNFMTPDNAKDFGLIDKVVVNRQ